MFPTARDGYRLLSSLLACALLPTTGRAADPQPVVVALMPQVAIKSRTVTVGDVADLRGGPAELRQSIARLDLVDVPSKMRSVLVTARQVAYRLRLGDIPA